MPISVDQATPNATDTQVTLSYNGNANLPVDSYTLYVRGDQLHDSSDAFTIALPNQIVVANAGTGDVSTLNAGTPLPASGTTPYFYQSVQSYPVWAETGATPQPVGIVTADFNGDGLLDVAVVNAGSREVDVYSGQANGVYNPTPLHLALPAGSVPVGVVGADLLNNGTTSLAVVDSTGHVDVLLNNFRRQRLVSGRRRLRGRRPARRDHGRALRQWGGSSAQTKRTSPSPTTPIRAASTSSTYCPALAAALGGAVAVQVGLDATSSNPPEGVFFPDAIAAGNLGTRRRQRPGRGRQQWRRRGPRRQHGAG